MGYAVHSWELFGFRTWVVAFRSRYGPLSVLRNCHDAGQRFSNRRIVAAAHDGERGIIVAVYSFMGFGMAFLSPLAVGGVLDITGGGTYGRRLALATLRIVSMSGPLWLRIFRKWRGDFLLETF